MRFEVVPDTITSALELEKGSADAASNVLTPDMVYALRDAPGLETASGPGSNVWYLNFNVADPALRDKRVRQAVALAMDREAIVAALWRGDARLAETLLPEGEWAAATDAEMAHYPHDPARAAKLLEEAGFAAGRDGVRLRLTLKISQDETTRLLAAVLQQQLRAAGIELKIRSAEFGTFYADVTHGAFQMYILKWIGSNEDPDIYRYMDSSGSFPPKGANRGHYVNARVDALLAKAAAESGPASEVEARRRAEYVEVQQILAEELPAIPLWFPDNVVVHTRRLQGVVSRGDGNFDFLREAWVRPREGLRMGSRFPRRLKPHWKWAACGGTKVPPFQDGDSFRDCLSRSVGSRDGPESATIEERAVCRGVGTGRLGRRRRREPRRTH